MLYTGFILYSEKFEKHTTPDSPLLDISAARPGINMPSSFPAMKKDFDALYFLQKLSWNLMSLLKRRSFFHTKQGEGRVSRLDISGILFSA